MAESITTDSNYLSSAFTTGTGAQILTFSKTVAADEEKPAGVLGSWLFSCEPLRQPQNQDLDSLISYMEVPSLRAFYVLDGSNIAGFNNEANPTNYNPMLVLSSVVIFSSPSLKP